MTFLVLLIALLVERFFDFGHLRHWTWVASLEAFVKTKLNAPSPWVFLAANVLPLVVVVMLVNVLLVKTLYGFPGLVFDVAVLLYCFGPRNFWADAFACINGLITNPSAAVETCHQAFGIETSADAGTRYRALLDRLFMAANARVFGVVFWYAILGVGGALLYRLVAFMAAQNEASEPAKMSLLVLDWAPVRLITLIFALAGNFTKVIVIWPKKAVLGLVNGDAMLVDCGIAGVGEDIANIPDDGKFLRAAVSMLDRTFIIALVVLLVGGIIL
ncbi:MAG TPA: regulatory signaling modulator protein AmpE [Gammaproteobacteria bacterium]|jgi:AmpE protein|nr:regulatory signaling modulator protein AmpE [Gammaproteobacteria bacterium]